MTTLVKAKKINKDNTIALILAIIFFIASLTLLCLVYQRPGEVLVLPEFEGSATSIDKLGTPAGYTDFNDPQIPFKCGLVAQPEISETGDGINLYFTNTKDNNVWLMVRITGRNGWISAKSGLLKPGEFVKELKGDFKPGEDIKIQVMSYKPQLYYSNGVFSLNTKVKGEAIDVSSEVVSSEEILDGTNQDLNGVVE